MSSDRLKQATEWFVEWEAADEVPLTREQLQAWREWAEDSQNLAAFDRMVQLRSDVRGLSPGVLRDRIDSPAPTSSHRVRYRLAAAAGVAVVGVIAFLTYTARTPSYATGLAEQRIIRMADGSTVTLGAKTALKIQYVANERRVVLRSGEALFDVAQEASRPFIVHAGNGSIRALGTAFVIRRDSDRVVVTVTDGRVEVAPDATAAPPKQLARGQQLSYGKAGNVSAVISADPQAAVAWSQGRLVFDHEPLRYVVQAVNRYAARQIVLDEAAGDLLYTGMVLHDQTEQWVRGLGRIFPLDIDAADGARVFVRTQSASK